MRKVLVTGADGQLGRSLRKAAMASSDLKFDFRNKESLDITDFENLSKLFESQEFDYCINCAAYTDVERAEKFPQLAYKINAEGVKNLASLCHLHKVKLIQVSTDYVFDGKKKGAYIPSDQPNPINEYGKSKLEGENYIINIMHKYFIVRTSWLYSEFGDNFYTKILAKAKRGETLRITDKQIGCPTNANSLASYLLQLIKMEREDYGIHHFTDEDPMTWYDFAHRILKDEGLETRTRLVRDSNYRTFAARPENSTLKNKCK